MFKNLYLVILLLISLIYPLHSFERLYILPEEKNSALTELIKLIKNSKDNIDIAMYSFTNKDISNALKEASNRGVKIRVALDRETDKNEFSRGGYLAKYKNIDVFLLDGIEAKNKKYNGKMHIKMGIFDNKTIVFGSANWTLSAFDTNYETLFITDSAQVVMRGIDGFREIIKNGENY